MYVATKIAEIEKMHQWGRDYSLGCVDLLLGDGAEHYFELRDQIQRGEETGAELMFRADLVEGDSAEAGTNSRV